MKNIKLGTEMEWSWLGRTYVGTVDEKWINGYSEKWMGYWCKSYHQKDPENPIRHNVEFPFIQKVTQKTRENGDWKKNKKTYAQIFICRGNWLYLHILIY